MSQSQENAANLEYWASQFVQRLLRELDDDPRAFMDGTFSVTTMNGKVALEQSTLTWKNKVPGTR